MISLFHAQINLAILNPSKFTPESGVEIECAECLGEENALQIQHIEDDK